MADKISEEMAQAHTEDTVVIGGRPTVVNDGTAADGYVAGTDRYVIDADDEDSDDED